ncbi:uncharacterized protein K452DRAFT_320370 [Aplosporella prunicola CBS 121167]|uniref:Peptidase A1 domain-containing protein n=1 Tax=Aplosporella prunicola CBS 121167 TaxID=1176127 RepID=A0A6A6BA42_9PEZI|nr:uncharacterized protein K452DRAFT_320370 [Aplosporella prunicola CBS 121167]KAF2139777.1 hypothetical protein K452DRAFT_320370 [Aplosporella prunicola CBS 121167]
MALCIGLILLPFSHAAGPWSLYYNVKVGPDGPWNAINFSIEYPARDVVVHPSLFQTSMLINASACEQNLEASCPLPKPGMWTGSGSQNLIAWKNSLGTMPSEWTDEAGMYMTEIMGLKGSMHYIVTRFTLQAPGRPSSYLDGAAAAVSDSISVNYPGGHSYMMDVGFFSLYGQNSTVNWESNNGTSIQSNTTVPLAKLREAISSTSYGLHVGSVSQNVSGSLTLGGYDRSRCIGTPITASSDQYLYLGDISLGVADGGSAFQGLIPEYRTSTFLEKPVTPSLPISRPLIQSPHYISFSFYTDGRAGSMASIQIPFALLSLNLTYPLVASETPYFPCRPFDPSKNTGPNTILGRAFLQGAFLAHNWDSKTSWLSQAPGPSFSPEDVHAIDPETTTLAAAQKMQPWNTTWEGVLTPLRKTTNSSRGSPDEDHGGLSTGAKAGIGVGAAVGGILLLGAAWLLLRRRKRGPEENLPQQPLPKEAPAYNMPPPGLHQEYAPMREAPPPAPAPRELDSNGLQELPEESVHELPGGGRDSPRK